MAGGVLFIVLDGNISFRFYKEHHAIRYARQNGLHMIEVYEEHEEVEVLVRVINI